MEIFYAGNTGNVANTAGNNITGIAAIPIGEGENDVKLSHDRYEVFVNGDKVGDKALLTQVDDVHDLKTYLENNGFIDFEYEVVGDHIEIKAKEDSYKMKSILSSYLSIK